MANIRASYVVSQVLLATTTSVVINIAAIGGATATAHATPVIKASAFVVPTSVLENQTVLMSDFRAFDIGQISIDVATATDDVALSFGAVFTDSVTIVENSIKIFSGTVDFDPSDPDVDPDPINIADVNAKTLGKTLTGADTATATDDLTKTPGKVVTDSVTSTDTINTKDVGKSLTDSAAAVDVVTAFDTAKVVADSATATDAAAKDFTRPNITDSVSTADDSSRQPELGKTETVTASDAFGPFAIGVNPSDAATAMDAVNTLAVSKVLTDSVEITDFIAKVPGYNFDFDVVDADADPDPVTTTDVMAKQFTRPNITDTVSATDVLNLFAISKVLTESATITDSVATLLVLGQTTPIYPDYVSMADGNGFVFHRYKTKVPNYTEVLGGADSLLNSDYMQSASDSHTHENYTGLINGPGLLLTAPLISGEFITYADTSGAGLVVNFHYTDAADRTVGGYQFNQTPIL